ncbi:BA75_04619T0 [Komagataella pastoris]|uniref:DNA-directed RNA polymerase III subunit RPC6 n=1 Tax=Komagataella pastoris TaxID=4922 RepID=A0A1B2JIV8_PICPA|nr:BA75_04619T0 [Komagataella pastoris]
MSGLSNAAKEIHNLLIANQGSSLAQEEILEHFKGKDLGEDKIESVADLMKHIQELLNRQLINLSQQGTTLKFSGVDLKQASKISNMSQDEAMIYSYIEGSGREGIWTKTIKAKTNLHQHIVLRCLKSLENQSFIKSVKSVKHPTRKIYMLYHLTPSIEVTGGPWFTDSELDTEFIDSLLIIIWRFIANKTYPNLFGTEGNKAQLYEFSVGLNNAPDVAQINKFIRGSGITNIELTDDDVRSLCDVLCYEEKIEKLEKFGKVDSYKVTWHSVEEAVKLDEPEGDVAPVFTFYDNHKVVNAVDIEDPDQNYYLDAYLNQ